MFKCYLQTKKFGCEKSIYIRNAVSTRLEISILPDKFISFSTYNIKARHIEHFVFSRSGGCIFLCYFFKISIRVQHAWEYALYTLISIKLTRLKNRYICSFSGLPEPGTFARKRDRETLFFAYDRLGLCATRDVYICVFFETCVYICFYSIVCLVTTWREQAWSTGIMRKRDISMGIVARQSEREIHIRATHEPCFIARRAQRASRDFVYTWQGPWYTGHFCAESDFFAK